MKRGAHPSRMLQSASGLLAVPADAALDQAPPDRARTLTAAPRLGYRPPLDGLRGVAILCVLAVNSGLSFFQGGFMGVDIFFVLSGFLITTLLAEEWSDRGMISLKNFYMRRALRLLPGLILLLIACCLYGLFFQSPAMRTSTFKEAGWVLFYCANWMLTVEHAVGSLDHAWSLSVEEQFYLLWPLGLCLLLRSGVKRERILLLLGLLVAASLAWRALLWRHGVHYLRLYYGSDTRADALLVGSALGLMFYWRFLPAGRSARMDSRMLVWLSVFCLLAVGIFLGHDAPALYGGGFTVIALASAVLLLEVVVFPDASAARGLSFPALVWMGRISYSLYLWHYPVFEALRPQRFAALGWNPVLVHGVRFAAVFAAASFSYYLVEQPFLSLKKRFVSGS